MADATKIVVMAGATGRLGMMTARILLERPGVQLRLLARPESTEKLSALQAKGAEVVAIDLEAPDNDALLAQAMQDAFCVVSTIGAQAGPDVMIGTQLRLLQAARDAGVRRFIPSCFSYDISGLEQGENLNSDILRAFLHAAQQVRGDVELVQIQIGAYADPAILFGFLGAFDLAAGEAFLWGDGNARMDFTTYLDTARFTAEAAIDDAVLPDILQFAGDSLTFHELVQAYEAGSGKSIAVQQLGTMADLDDEIGRRMQAEPQNFFAWLPLMYWRAMLSGKVALQSIGNDRYPHVKPMSMADYVREAGL